MSVPFDCGWCLGLFYHHDEGTRTDQVRMFYAVRHVAAAVGAATPGRSPFETGRDRDAVEIVRHDDVVELVAGFGGERVRVAVATREVGEHESSSTSASGEPSGFSGGEVAVLGRQVLLGRQEGRLAHEQIGTVGEFEGAVAPRGVHDESERLTAPGFAHIFDPHGAPVDLEASASLQASDFGTGDPVRRQPIREHPPAVGFLHPPAERVDTVFEPGAAQDEPVIDVNDSRTVGPTVDRDILLPCRGVTQTIEVLLTAGWIVDRYGQASLIECHPQDHAGQAETVVAVEMGDADPRDNSGGDTGERELALGALTRIEQHAFTVPAQQVPVVVALPRRRLAGRPQDDEFALGHPTGLPRREARDALRPKLAQAGRGSRCGRRRFHDGSARTTDRRPVTVISPVRTALFHARSPRCQSMNALDRATISAAGSPPGSR